MLFELRPISVSDATFGQKDSDGEEEGGDPSGYNCDHSSRNHTWPAESTVVMYCSHNIFGEYPASQGSQ
ncbi:hypothetical protein DPMN_179310 [Dreissena polymorpha]|uniref:Uncharacterized protein n=1 Tax=Dreissena polymorpha TaxID=45954 RepID=A0A9D4IM82_DREPO|nr:hypothetical protein DPMN_179310 [Dreissena polymorpha]